VKSYRGTAHQDDTGAKYTWANPPVEILVVREGFTKSKTSKIEYAIKKMLARSKVQALKNFQLPDPELEEDLDYQEELDSGPRM
jgi:predicted GIY-YIG superfamily endonuclease